MPGTNGNGNGRGVHQPTLPDVSSPEYIQGIHAAYWTARAEIGPDVARHEATRLAWAKVEKAHPIITPYLQAYRRACANWRQGGEKGIPAPGMLIDAEAIGRRLVEVGQDPRKKGLRRPKKTQAPADEQPVSVAERYRQAAERFMWVPSDAVVMALAGIHSDSTLPTYRRQLMERQGLEFTQAGDGSWNVRQLDPQVRRLTELEREIAELKKQLRK